ncbi:unnamed protein product, partial [Choristocarpus tenellus]
DWGGGSYDDQDFGDASDVGGGGDDKELEGNGTSATPLPGPSPPMVTTPSITKSPSRRKSGQRVGSLSKTSQGKSTEMVLSPSGNLSNSKPSVGRRDRDSTTLSNPSLTSTKYPREKSLKSISKVLSNVGDREGVGAGAESQMVPQTTVTPTLGLSPGPTPTRSRLSSPRLSPRVGSSPNRSLRSNDRSPRSNDRSPRSKDRFPRSKDRSPRSKDRSPRSKDQSPKSKDQSPRSKDRSPRSKDRSPRSKDRSPSLKDQSPISMDRSPKVKGEDAGKSKDKNPEDTKKKGKGTGRRSGVTAPLSAAGKRKGRGRMSMSSTVDEVQETPARG